MPRDAASARFTLFLDDGGVMSDNDRRTLEWRRLVGEFLAPRLGGSRSAWAEANRVVFEGSWQRYLEAVELAGGGYLDYFAFWEPEHERWLREMCQHVGVAVPSGDACLRLAKETDAYVIPRIRAAFPGAVDAIRELRAQGYTLSTASGGSSLDLDGYLSGMGVRALFMSRLYGPDLVHTPKDGPQFYERIFADAGVEPAAALVVDDLPRAVQWAAQVGATAVLVSSDQHSATKARAVIRSLAELPSLMGRITE